MLCLRGELGVDRPKSGVLANRLGVVILLTTALGEMLIPNVFRRGEDGGVVAVCVAVIVAIGKQSEKTKEGSKLMWGVNEMNVSYRRLLTPSLSSVCAAKQEKQAKLRSFLFVLTGPSFVHPIFSRFAALLSYWARYACVMSELQGRR